MFIHFGDSNVGLFNSRKGNIPLLSQYMIDSPGPVVISISQEEDEEGQIFTPAVVADAMNAIYMSNRSVFVKVSCSPSVIRTGVDAAVSDAKYQIDAIYDLFVGYQLQNKLAGFALNNIFFGQEFNDETVWTIAHLNKLIDAIHAKAKSAMVITDPGIASLSRLVQPLPYGDVDGSFLSTVSRIGFVENITDYIVHMNVLFPWHTWVPEAPELTFDFSRFSAIVTLMQNNTKSNIKHYCHQSNVQTPDIAYSVASFDYMLGVVVSPYFTNRIMRAAQFIEACGIVDYTFTHDSNYGALSNVAFHPLFYRGGNRTPFYSDIVMSSRNGNISVTNTVLDTTRVFDSGLKELNIVETV